MMRVVLYEAATVMLIRTAWSFVFKHGRWKELLGVEHDLS